VGRTPSSAPDPWSGWSKYGKLGTKSIKTTSKVQNGLMPAARIVLCFALCAAALLAQVPEPNFTGVWKFVPSKSTVKITHFSQVDLSALALAPALPALDRSPEIIEHKGNQFTVRGRTATIDAPESATPAEGGLVRISRTYWDGDKLLTEWRLESAGKALIQCWEVRRLSPDGKEQVVDTRIESPEKRRDSHSVFSKTR
jgi:hypothetical protein